MAGLTHEERRTVEAALELLKPSIRKRREARRDIIFMIDFVNGRSSSAKAFKAFNARKGRAALRRYVKALREVGDSFSSTDPNMRPWLSPPDVQGEIAKVESFLARPSLPPKRAATRAKAGVAAAYSLLKWWDIEVNTSRGSIWEQLSQILSGSSASMYEHMREFNRTGAPIFKKMRARRGVVRSLLPTEEAIALLQQMSQSTQ
jgi:hypothetical protein